MRRPILAGILMLGAGAMASGPAPVSIEEAASRCLAESNPQAVHFHYLNHDGKPYHSEGSVYLQASCRDAKTATDYFRAASLTFKYQDEPYHPDTPDTTRRVFHREKGSGLFHGCFFRGRPQDPEMIACYFNMAIPGRTTGR